MANIKKLFGDQRPLASGVFDDNLVTALVKGSVTGKEVIKQARLLVYGSFAGNYKAERDRVSCCGVAQGDDATAVR